MQTGTVKFFRSTEGWGFIRPDDGDSDVFAHIRNTKDQRALKDGDRVQYRMGIDPKSGRDRGEEIELID